MFIRDRSPGWASNKSYDFKYDPLEMPVSNLGASDLGTYDDVAVVVLGRSNGEGADYKPGGEGSDEEGNITGGVVTGVGARNALALSQNAVSYTHLRMFDFFMWTDCCPQSRGILRA